MNSGRDLFGGIRAQRMPVTWALIGLLALTLVASLGRVDGLMLALALKSPGLSEPWTYLTYPFSCAGPGEYVSFVFAGIWLWSMGQMLEGEIGSGAYLGLFLAGAAIEAVAVVIGGSLQGMKGGVFDGPWLPITAVTVVCASRYPNTMIQLFGVIPIAMKWVGWFSAGLILFYYGGVALAAGIAGTAALGLFYAYGVYGGTGSLPFVGKAAESKMLKKTERLSAEYYNDVQRRAKEREERERLKRLFESSSSDEDER